MYPNIHYNQTVTPAYPYPQNYGNYSTAPEVPATQPVVPPGMLMVQGDQSMAPAMNPYYASADLVRFQQPVAVENFHARPLDVRINYQQFQQLQETMNRGFNNLNKSMQDVYSYLSSIYRYGLPVRDY